MVSPEAIKAAKCSLVSAEQRAPSPAKLRKSTKREAMPAEKGLADATIHLKSLENKKLEAIDDADNPNGVDIGKEHKTENTDNDLQVLSHLEKNPRRYGFRFQVNSGLEKASRAGKGAGTDRMEKENDENEMREPASDPKVDHRFGFRF